MARPAGTILEPTGANDSMAHLKLTGLVIMTCVTWGVSYQINEFPHDHDGGKKTVDSPCSTEELGGLGG